MESDEGKEKEAQNEGEIRWWLCRLTRRDDKKRKEWKKRKMTVKEDGGV